MNTKGKRYHTGVMEAWNRKGYSKQNETVCTLSNGNFIDSRLIIILVSFVSGANAKYSSLAHNNSKTWVKGADMSLFPTSTSMSLRIYLHRTFNQSKIRMSKLQQYWKCQQTGICSLLTFYNPTLNMVNKV